MQAVVESHVSKTAKRGAPSLPEPPGLAKPLFLEECFQIARAVDDTDYHYLVTIKPVEEQMSREAGDAGAP